MRPYFKIAMKLNLPLCLVGDAYYKSQKLMNDVKENGALCTMVTRCRSNSKGWKLPKRKTRKRKRGRPAKYGEAVSIGKWARDDEGYKSEESPLRRDKGCKIEIKCIKLLCRGIEGLQLFVAVRHPIKGSITLVCTNTEMDPVDVYHIYARRTKIEVTFRTLKEKMWGHSYRFFMKGRDKSDKVKLGKLAQDLTTRDEGFKKRYMKKLQMYERYVSIQLIAQGILTLLSFKNQEEIKAATQDSSAYVMQEHFVKTQHHQKK